MDFIVVEVTGLYDWIVLLVSGMSFNEIIVFIILIVVIWWIAFVLNRRRPHNYRIIQQNDTMRRIVTSEENQIDVEQFNELSEQQFSRLKSFLEYFDEQLLQFKRNDDEVKDITDAVRLAVENFVATIESKYPHYAVSRIEAVGSMAEGTRIIQPDEFDFIVVLKNTDEMTFCVDTVQPNSDNPEDALHDLDAPFKHVHLRLGEKMSESYKYKGCLRNWTNVLFKNETELAFPWTYQNDHSFGKLEFLSPLLNGPAMTLKMSWTPNRGNKILDVDVDVVLAIEMTGSEGLIDGTIKNCAEYMALILERNTYFLIPIKQFYTKDEPSACFKHSFVNVELEIMRRLSKQHKLCYRFLKYLLQEQYKGYRYKKVNTYVLKTIFIQHTWTCGGNHNAAKCIVNIIKTLHETDDFPEELYMKKAISCQVNVLKELLEVPKKQLLYIASSREENDTVIRRIKRELEIRSE